MEGAGCYFNSQGFYAEPSSDKESACQCRRHGFDPWFRKIPWSMKEPLQYSCLENSMDREAWQATVYEVTESWTRLNYAVFVSAVSRAGEITRVYTLSIPSKCFLHGHINHVKQVVIIKLSGDGHCWIRGRMEPLSDITPSSFLWSHHTFSIDLITPTQIYHDISHKQIGPTVINTT